MAPSKSNSVCAACRSRRMKCTENCPFAPYFPADKPERWSVVYKQYGARNLVRLLSEVKESDRVNAVKSLVYEAAARKKDPVYGCVGLISAYQKRLRELQTQVNSYSACSSTNSNNAAFDLPHSNNAQPVMNWHGGTVGWNNSNNAAFDLPAKFPLSNMAQQAEILEAQQQAMVPGGTFIPHSQQGGDAVRGNNSNSAAFDFAPNNNAQPVMNWHGGTVGGNNSTAFDLPAMFPLNNMAQQAEILEAQQLQQHQQAMVPGGTFILPYQQGSDAVGGNNRNSAAFDFAPNNMPQELLEAQQLAAAVAQQQHYYDQAMLWNHQQRLPPQGGELYNHQHHHHVPQAVIQDPQEQEFLEAARLQKQYGQANFMTQAVMDGQGLIQDQELLEAHDQLAAAAFQQQLQEMMRSISGFGSVHGGGESSSSQPQALNDNFGGYQNPPVEAQQQHLLSTPPQSQAQQRRLDHEAGRSVGPLLFLISEFFFASNVQLTSSCFWVQL